jgi:transcription initiation factor TFIIIB Brf1 subunit/transcription initiation factor TFIIB
MPYKERSLYNVLKEIQEKCRDNSILKCIEDDAKILYKNISECRHIRGKNKGKAIIIRGSNRKSLIAVCVYYACLRKGQTRSPKEIADIFDLKYTDITKGCKTFIKLMKIKKMEYIFNSSKPEHFIPRFCKTLHINSEYTEQAVKIAKNIVRLNIASVHTPLSIATGSILLLTDIYDLAINKKMIATTFSVSEVTISKAHKELINYKNILLNDDATDKVAAALEIERKKIQMPESLKIRYIKIKKERSDQNSDSESSPSSDSSDSLDVRDSDKEDMDFTKIKFSIETDSLNSYMDSINADLYDQIGRTDLEFRKLYLY